MAEPTKPQSPDAGPKITAIWTKDGGVDLIGFSVKSFLQVMAADKKATAPKGPESTLEMSLDKSRGYIICRYLLTNGTPVEFWVPREHIKSFRAEPQ